MESLTINCSFIPDSSNCACGFDKLREDIESLDISGCTFSSHTLPNTFDLFNVSFIGIFSGDSDIEI